MEQFNEVAFTFNGTIAYIYQNKQKLTCIIQYLNKKHKLMGFNKAFVLSYIKMNKK